MSVLVLYAAIFSLINLLQNDDSTKEERPSKRVRSDVDIDPLMSAVLPDPSSFSDPKIWKGHQLESPLLLNHRFFLIIAHQLQTEFQSHYLTQSLQDSKSSAIAVKSIKENVTLLLQ